MIKKKIGWKPIRTSTLILLLFVTNIMLHGIINPGDKMEKGDISLTDILKVKTKLKKYFNLKTDEIFIIVDPEIQKMSIIKGEKILKTYSVSTSRFGLGCKSGTNQTPTGTHRIKEKIGNNAGVGRIFRGRVDTGKNAKIYEDSTDLEKDEVTTRILWLDGMENRINRSGNVDSHKRYIYIHGTPEEGLIGTPASHGCIRMKNSDVIEFFNFIPSKTLIEILNKPYKKKIVTTDAG